MAKKIDAESTVIDDTTSIADLRVCDRLFMASSLASSCLPMIPANQFFQALDLGLLVLDLRLLLLDGVNEYGSEAVVLDAFDFALRIARYQPRFDRGDFLCCEAEITFRMVLPGERDRPQPIYNIEATDEGIDIFFVAQA